MAGRRPPGGLGLDAGEDEVRLSWAGIRSFMLPGVVGRCRYEG